MNYIRDHASDDCEIELFGHSRGAVATIILARIISQKYPNVKVIAHDPVPGNRSIPLLQESYYKKKLDVSSFLGGNDRERTIEDILTDNNLAIRGALTVPWRRNDNRPDFALLDGEHVYDADYFFPVELPGFHSMGLYHYTSIDYSVLWENTPFVDSYVKQNNKRANQGEDKIDGERDAIKSIAQNQYHQLVELFTQAQMHEFLSLPYLYLIYIN